jgi:predicted patatin/cPLA2 family phospholipase
MEASPMPGPTKRALILAGGGLKVGFQAGVLQVWLDEAGVTFDHADGASGGCFNLAMYCQGQSGTRIADNWRTLDPFLPVDLNWQSYWRLANAPSLFTYDNFREKVLPFWGIDFAKIRRGKLGTFNILNFSKKRVDVITNDQLTEDYLIGAVSLPMWFPPVVINGQTFIDAVYITDANVEEAIRRGADEIWAIWTVSTRDEWRPGFVSQYFHIIEAVADTHFFGIWSRIEKSNAAIAAGGSGEFGRHIGLKLLQAEVPMHYIFNFSSDRMAESVNLGVKMAREWCARQGIPLRTPVAPEAVAAAAPPAPTSLRFTEEMKGHAARGVTDPAAGDTKGRADGTPLAVRLTVSMNDLDRFITDPGHQASANGWVESPLIGGRRPVADGIVNLLVSDADPTYKEMRYRLFFTDDKGAPLTLTGVKNIHDDGGFDIWPDTTTLYTTILPGTVRNDDASMVPVAAGIIRIHWDDFLRQLTTFQSDAPTLGQRIAAINRFGVFFFGKIWDVFLRQFVEYSPV